MEVHEERLMGRWVIGEREKKRKKEDKDKMKLSKISVKVVGPFDSFCEL